MTNILTLKVATIVWFATNVYPLKVSEGFNEREFLTNIVQHAQYEFVVSSQLVKFVSERTNSSIVGVYTPHIITNLVPKRMYWATPGQLGYPIEAYIKWYPENTQTNK